MIEGGQVEVEAEEMEEDVGADLSSGVDCKNNEELGPCGSAGVFLPGVETEGDPPGRIKVEADALEIKNNDSNKAKKKPVTSNLFVSPDQSSQKTQPLKSKVEQSLHPLVNRVSYSEIGRR